MPSTPLKCVVAATALLLACAATTASASTPSCDPASFNDTTHAAACDAANALVSTWYSALEGTITKTQFWGGANGVQGIIDFMQRTDSRAFAPLVAQVKSRRPSWIVELLGSGSYDDMQWWSLMYLSAARVLGASGAAGGAVGGAVGGATSGGALDGAAYLAEGKAIFDHVWSEAYDAKACGGGLWWSKKKSYKNAITNELAVANAALLHLLLPGDTAYLAKAKKQWEWFNASGMVSQELGLVADGLGADCKSNGGSCCSGYVRRRGESERRSRPCSCSL